MDVLISIRPEWCDKIISGEKTIEVRKTRPKIDTPFRCYIYETKGKTNVPWMDEDGHMIFKGQGMVIGQFICDSITRFGVPYPAYHEKLDQDIKQQSCLSYMNLHDYAGHRDLYGWHISELNIYDEPKELKQFQIPTTFPARRIRQAPQSWIYVEEIT